MPVRGASAAQELQAMIKVMSRHNLINNKTLDNDKVDDKVEEKAKTRTKTNTKTNTMTKTKIMTKTQKKTNTFREHIQRATLETCDL